MLGGWLGKCKQKGSISDGVYLKQNRIQTIRHDEYSPIMLIKSKIHNEDRSVMDMYVPNYI